VLLLAVGAAGLALASLRRIAALDPCRVPDDCGACIAVAAGAGHTVALRSDGTVRCWGADDFGQGDPPHGLRRIKAIAAGGRHAAAVAVDGTVACWGDNSCGQCDVPVDLPKATKIAAGGFHTIALLEDGNVLCWGGSGRSPFTGGIDVDFGQCDVPDDLGPCADIAGGLVHTVALRVDGTVRCWGAGKSNDFERMAVASGLAEVGLAARPTEAMMKSRFALNWGQSNVPSQIVNCRAIAAGLAHSLAVHSVHPDSDSSHHVGSSEGQKLPSRITSWGGTESGFTESLMALASQIDPAVQFARLRQPHGDFIALAAGGLHSIALQADGSVVAWGLSLNGECDIPANLGRVDAVAAGASHTVVLMKDGTIRAWGARGEPLQDPSLLIMGALGICLLFGIGMLVRKPKPRLRLRY
jgi:alpha-tubulin suppressor-like RCC1 family protein